LWLIGSFNVFLIGRELVNVALTWRAARAVIALHRHVVLDSQRVLLFTPSKTVKESFYSRVLLVGPSMPS